HHPHPNAPEVLLCFLPGLLPRPSIRAEPGPVVPRGRPVTVLCQGPAGADIFRVEKNEHRSTYTDHKITSQQGSPGTEARFPIRAVSDVTAGPYRCVYMKWSRWSERSEALDLVLTGEEVPVLPSGLSQVPGHSPELCPLDQVGTDPLQGNMCPFAQDGVKPSFPLSPTLWGPQATCPLWCGPPLIGQVT
uniref:Uncharacterized protein n=1 Tax=Rhinolophus ferrumequinum TaxID=59479 RepID=A0A671ERI6_RHIFE